MTYSCIQFFDVAELEDGRCFCLAQVDKSILRPTKLEVVRVCTSLLRKVKFAVVASGGRTN